ncbi:MAG: hypothetical protein HC913_18975 [Microscillaceae bacterium]|nr:hypothetical protein [Microscillaceae bacterium]
MQDLEPLREIQSLVLLKAGFTAVQNLSPLESLPLLEKLYLWATPIQDLSPLFHLPKLYKVFIPLCNKLSPAQISTLKKHLHQGQVITEA